VHAIVDGAQNPQRGAELGMGKHKNTYIAMNSPAPVIVMLILFMSFLYSDKTMYIISLHQGNGHHEYLRAQGLGYLL